MKDRHDCRMGDIEVHDDNHGNLFLVWEFWTYPPIHHRIDFCPVCGEKSKESLCEMGARYQRKDKENELD